MIEFETPDGRPIWLFKAWVQLVREPLPDEYPGEPVGAVIIMSSFVQAVKEDFSTTVRSLWNEGR